MNTLRARVVNGRLKLDEPCELPEGSIIELVVADGEDDLDEKERRELHASLEKSWEGAKSGQGVRPASEVLRDLRKAR